MKNLKVGDYAEITKTFSSIEVEKFAELSCDSNPVHLDISYAEKTFFKKTIVHGMLVSSLFGGLLGSVLPGRGTIYLGQELKFQKPNYVEESLRAIIEIIHIRVDKPIYTFSTKCYNSINELTIDGKAIIMYTGEFFAKQS